ncbi:MAG: nitrilase-related carbon-nitrogen hydrolase, partial [Candidatus Berkiella sp.]
MRISLAQLNYKIGDFSGNYAKIENVITQHAKNTDLIVFTELCLSGYYPMDLIESAPFISAQNACLAQLEQLTQKHQISIIIGFIDINQGKGKPFHNSLCLISKGKRTFTYHKRLLPVYDIFDEARHFTPGKEAGIFQFEGLQFGFLICEDGWVGDNKYLYDCDPVSELSKHNLDVIICINGSPSNIGKQALRCQHFTPIAQTCHAPLIFTNQVGGNDDILYDGASFVLDADGKPLGSLAQFKEDFATLTLNKKTLE